MTTPHGIALRSGVISIDSDVEGIVDIHSNPLISIGPGNTSNEVDAMLASFHIGGTYYGLFTGQLLNSRKGTLAKIAKEPDPPSSYGKGDYYITFVDDWDGYSRTWPLTRYVVPEAKVRPKRELLQGELAREEAYKKAASRSLGQVPEVTQEEALRYYLHVCTVTDLADAHGDGTKAAFFDQEFDIGVAKVRVVAEVNPLKIAATATVLGVDTSLVVDENGGSIDLKLVKITIYPVYSSSSTQMWIRGDVPIWGSVFNKHMFDF